MFEVKEKCLQLLVDKGILTEEEFEKCINVIKEDNINVDNLFETIEIEPTKRINNNYLYEDYRICVKYKGLQEITNLFYGKGISIRFLVENKTSQSIRVHGTEITINGFMVDDDAWLVSELPANKKTIDGLNLFYGKLEEYDINSIDDIETIELKIMTELMEDGSTIDDTENESYQLELDI